MRHLLCALVLAALASAASAQGPGLPDAAAVADPQPLSSAHHVMPAAASVAPEGGPTGRVTFLQLGKCTADTGMSSNLGTCQANAALTRPGQSNWYRFNVLESDSAFTLHLLIRVQNGRVRMGLWAPGQSLDMPPSMTSDTLLSSSFAQELYITIPASQLFANPGIYILQVVNDYGAPEYTLQADVTSGVTLLAQQDRAALQQVVTDCCPSGDGMVCSLLTSALTADSMDTDICHQGPVRCNKAGHISDLVLQGTNTDMDLTCPGFSEGFAQLPELQRLDLAGANLGATTSTVGRMLAPAAKLKWLVLRTSGLLGDISCDILLPGLTLLSLTRNGLTGVIPDCLTRTESLLHLYLSDNALRGPLPDFSPTTSLQLLFARDQSVDGSPSLTGQLPASLASAPHLAYLQLSNVGLTGSVGTLPPMMRYFNVSQNDLSGMLPPLPQSLISFDISGNTIGGSLPADMSSFEQLVDIQAYFNELEGHLPAKLPPNLVQLALAGNRLTGGLPPLPRGLRYLSLAQNSLQGGLPNGPAASGLWFADLSSNSFAGMLPAALAQSDELVYLNVSNNKLEGIEEPAAWSTPRLLTLDASNNMIKGALAGELAAQPVLAYINFGNNQLSGDLQAFAKALVPDRPVGAVFDVSNNALTGGLPEGLGNLAALSTAPAAFPSWNPLDTTGYPVKVFNVADNRLDGPFPDFLITSMTGLVSQACVQSPGDCNMWVSVNGEGNRLACPAPLGAAAQAEQLPEHLALLQRQNLGCTGKDGTLYEVASVLAGHPVALRVEQAPERPEAQPVAASSEPRGSSSSTLNAGEPRTVVAAAAAAPAPTSSSSRRALPPGAIAGIVIGAVAAAALVAALGYVVVYRRWYTVRAANSFKKMHEGPLAAAGGATINSSAPAAGLPTLGAVAGDETV